MGGLGGRWAGEGEVDVCVSGEGGGSKGHVGVEVRQAPTHPYCWRSTIASPGPQQQQKALWHPPTPPPPVSCHPPAPPAGSTAPPAGSPPPGCDPGRKGTPPPRSPAAGGGAEGSRHGVDAEAVATAVAAPSSSSSGSTPSTSSSNPQPHTSGSPHLQCCVELRGHPLLPHTRHLLSPQQRGQCRQALPVLPLLQHHLRRVGRWVGGWAGAWVRWGTASRDSAQARQCCTRSQGAAPAIPHSGSWWAEAEQSAQPSAHAA